MTNKERFMEDLAAAYSRLARWDQVNFDLGNDPNTAQKIEAMRRILDDLAKRFGIVP